MILLITPQEAQKKWRTNARSRRLAMGLTQEGLADRSGVALPTLRKFEQKGTISLESALKMLMVIGGLEEMIKAIEPKQTSFSSIDEVLKANKKVTRQRGYRK